MDKRVLYIGIQIVKIVVFLAFAAYFLILKPEGTLPPEAYTVLAVFLILYSLFLGVRIFQFLKQKP